MKKIFLLLLAVTFFCIPIAFANSDEPHLDKRWYWVGSNREDTLYVDTKTLHYDVNTDMATCFVLTITPSKGVYSIRKYTISFSGDYVIEGKGEKYSKGNDSPIASYNRSVKLETLPGTMGENLVNVVNALVGRDDKYNYREDIKLHPGHIAY